MALRNVVKYGDPILRKKSRTVEVFDRRIATLVEDMFETMYKDNGVGLAAVQVGILKRIVVIDCGDGPVDLINPEIGEDLKARAFCHEIDHLDGVLFIDRMDKTVKKD